MLRFLKRFFLPTRFDICWLVVVLHWLTAAWCITIAPSFQTYPNFTSHVVPMIQVACATWLAIAATLCWRTNSRKRTLLLLLSSIASLALVIGWTWCYPDSFQTYLDSRARSQGRLVTKFDGWRFINDILPWIGWGLLSAFGLWVVNSLACLASRRLFAWLKGRSTTAAEMLGGDRTKLLVGVAAALFVIAVGSRFVGSLGVGFGGMDSLSAAQFTLSIFSLIVGWLIGFFWFPRSFSLSPKPVQKLCSLLLTIALMTPLFVNAYNQQVGFFEIFTGFVFVLAVIGVSGAVKRSGDESEETVEKVASRPTLFSLVTSLVLVGFVGLVSLVDIGALSTLHPTRNKIEFDDLVEFVKSSAIIKWRSGGRIRAVSNYSHQNVLWKASIDESSPDDLLHAIEGFRLTAIELNNLNPQIDVSPLQGNAMVVIMSDCNASNTQLSQILNSVSWLEISGDLTVVDDGTVVDPGTVTSISFKDTRPGDLANFIDVTNCADQLRYTMIQTPVNNKDWPAIEEIAQTGFVYIQGGFADDFVMPTKTKSLSQVYVYGSSSIYPGKRKVDRNLLLNTDIQFGSNLNTVAGPEFDWKIMMLRGSGNWRTMDQHFLVSDKDIDQFARDVGMAYRLNDDETIHSLYFPSGSSVSDIASLTELRVLSFDPLWTSSNAAPRFGFAASITDVSHLKPLGLLEELYFESNFIPQDISFLADLGSLKHLQIPSIDRSVTGDSGFDACQSLESITFYGRPDNKTLHELSRLKNLKRLVIFNNEMDDSLSPKMLEKLKDKFPGVRVQFLQKGEEAKLISGHFREYREKMREQLRSDTRWIDDYIE